MSEDVKDTVKRTRSIFRMSIPSEDVSTRDWIDSQINASTSLRRLIHEDIKSNGFTDVTCRPAMPPESKVESLGNVDE